MNHSTRHNIDDTDQIRPHMRLCHRMLSEGLTAGYTAVELATDPGGAATARAQTGGSWKSYMAFPSPVYQQLVVYFKQMAGLASDEPATAGTILVRYSGRDASIKLEARRSDQGADELLLLFPAGRDAAAT